MIDFRSDTVTRPSAEMREAMANAEVGDDVFGDDPTINKLEELGAKMFGKEAGLFCSSGTQTNQVAITVHVKPGDEVICHEEAHVYRYEGGGIARNAGASMRFLRGNNGRINPEEIYDQINPDDQHYPVSRLVCLEDTANRGGGYAYDYAVIQRSAAISKELGLAHHLDGARVFNALAVNGIKSQEYGANFDSISICLSKGLGAPVGSLLVGSKDFIAKARRVRKVFGGGMRQAGIIAAGGIYALENNIERLVDDHKNAKLIEGILSSKSWIDKVLPTETNIVVAHLAGGLNEYAVVEKIKESGILCVPFGKGRIRFTTHLDVSENDIDLLSEKLPHQL
ncbi:MAG: beta-eliminating lyase-related protein [Crocinitomicaceae bacterium]|nr:beta-eliminating lyase-related protein [Crocinitomicaceae bacterium]